MKMLLYIVIILGLFGLGYLIGYNSIDTKYITSTDTLYTHTTDTMYITYTSEVLVPVKIYHTDTLYLGDSVKQYVSEYSDSLLNATVTSTVDGTLVNQSFKYTASIPHITDSVFVNVTNTNTIVENKSMLLLGVEYNKNLALAVGYDVKNKLFIKYSYEPNNKVHTFGLYKPIKFK